MLLSESCTGKQGRQHFTPRAKGTSDGAYAVATTSAAIGTAINATSSERHWTAYTRRTHWANHDHKPQTNQNTMQATNSCSSSGANTPGSLA